MADPKAPAETKDGQVRAYDRLGNKITIDKAEVGKLYAMGGKVATRVEQDAHDAEVAKAAAAKAEQERYDKLPTINKVAGAAAAAAGLAAGPAGFLGSAASAPSQSLRAASHGVGEGVSMGLADVAGRKAAEAIGGKEAGDRYAQHVDEVKAASPIAHGIGEATGMLAGAALSSGAGAAAKALPAAGLTALGEATEAGVAAGARALGYTGRTALGRAAVSAAELGARGAVEGAAMAGVQAGADAVLHDVAPSSDKIFAAMGTGALYGGLGGAALGASGSLAKSAAGAVIEGVSNRARGALARAMAPTEEAGAVRAATESMTEGTPLTAAVEGKVRNLSNEMAFDALGATKTQMRDALEHVQGGKAAVGEYVNRIGIAKAAEGASGVASGAWRAGMAGRADDLLAAIQADKGGRIATGLSEAIKGTPARVSIPGLGEQAEAIYTAMLKDPTKIAGAESFRSRISLEMKALENAGKIAADGTIDAAEAFYTRSAMAKQAYEMSRTSGAAGDAYKQFLREMDRTTVGALDKAAEAAGKGSIGDSIRYWKREWQLASAAEEAALGGAERIAGNNTFGIRESIGALTAIATGNVLGGIATGIAGKIARERGSAVGAYALSQLAERGTLTRMVQKMDDQIARASRGLVQPPAKGSLSSAERMPPTKGLAKTALTRVAEFQSDPEAYIDKATRNASIIAAHSPEIADAIVSKQVQAAAFLASKVPVSPDPDPLDPHPAPKLTSGEQIELARYAWYTEKPERFFKEVARGTVTFEGAETAKELMPDAFAQLQAQTLDAIATQKARGATMPYRQQVMLGLLLDIAAVPAQRPDHMRFLQANLEVTPQNDPAPGKPPIPGGGAKSAQPSSYDRLEASGPGR